MSPENTYAQLPELNGEFTIGDGNRLTYLRWIFSYCAGSTVDPSKLSTMLSKPESDLVDSTFKHFLVRPTSNLGILIQLTAAKETIDARSAEKADAWSKGRGGRKIDTSLNMVVGGLLRVMEKKIFACKPKTEIARLHEAFFYHRLDQEGEKRQHVKRQQRDVKLRELIDEWEQNGYQINALAFHYQHPC